MAGSNKLRITGWVLSVLLALFLIGGSATPKFVDWEGKEEMFQKLGFTTEVMTKIGVVEALLAILLVIPRTGFLAAILLTGYLGGATVTHVRVGEPFFFPIIMGVVIWLAVAFRKPEIFTLAMGGSLPSAAPQVTE